MKTCFVTALTDSSTTDLEGVGNRRYGELGEVYVWTKNANASVAMAATEPVCWTIANTSTLFKEVKHPLTANLNAFAGVVKSTIIAAGSYGWVQTRGLASVKVKGDGTAQAAGSNLLVTDGTLRMETDTAPATAPKYRAGAVSLEANTSATGTVVALIQGN